MHQYNLLLRIKISHVWREIGDRSLSAAYCCRSVWIYIVCLLISLLLSYFVIIVLPPPHPPMP